MTSTSSAEASPSVSGVTRVPPSQPSPAKLNPNQTESSNRGKGKAPATVNPLREHAQAGAAAVLINAPLSSRSCSSAAAAVVATGASSAVTEIPHNRSSRRSAAAASSASKVAEETPAAAAKKDVRDGKKSSKKSTKSTPYNRKRPDNRGESKVGSKRSRSIGSNASGTSTGSSRAQQTPLVPSRSASRTPLGRVNQAEPPSNNTTGGRKRKAVAATPLSSSVDTTTATPSNTRVRQQPGFRTPVAPTAGGGRCPLSAGQIKNKDKRNGNGETPLHKASIKGDLATVVAYIGANADVNTKCNGKWTPLHEVCSHGHLELVAPLLEARANANMPGGVDRNCTPLHDAAESGHADIVELLLSVGRAKVDVLDADGQLPKDLTDDPKILQLLELGGGDRGQTQPRRCKVLNTSGIVDPGGAGARTGDGNRLAHALGNRSIVITGITSEEEKKRVKANAKRLGLTVLPDMSPEVTHLVTPVDERHACKRTFKYLCAIVMGKRIVSPKWLATSVQKKELVDESLFEPHSDSAMSGKFAAQKGFMAKATGEPSLFDSCSFFFKGDFSSSSDKLKADKLEKLVQLGGGEVLTREPREMTRWKSLHHATEPKKFKSPTFIVVGGAKKNQVRASGIHEITGSYLLQCISNFALDDPSVPIAVV